MKIELIGMEPGLALAVRKRANAENFKELINEGYDQLQKYLVGLGKEMSGPPFVAYYMCGEEFDMDMGFPVAEEIPGTGDLYMCKTPSGKAVTGMYTGSYKGLEQAYGEIFKYIEENSLEPTGVYYDYYLNDPAVTPEDELETKIVIPLK